MSIRPHRAEATKRALSLVTAVALTLVGALTLTMTDGGRSAAAAEPLPNCPPDSTMPLIGHVPTYTDSNVAVYAGGNYLADGTAAESEGLLLVRGNATFDKPGGTFNVGSVGLGSGITPAGGEQMLAVGGNLVATPTTTVAVGALVDGGGAATVGGTASGTIDNYSATLVDGLGQSTAMAPHDAFQSVVDDNSAILASTPATGVTSVVGALATFTGSLAGNPQVFDVNASDLSAVGEVHFVDIPADTPILVNVTGGPDLSFSPYYFSLNGTRVDDLASSQFGNAASQILWNVADAATLTVGGSSQVIGSFLAPKANATVTASTNGRFYVGGDLHMAGDGNEQHNYPWIGGHQLGCTDATSVGGFALSKSITGAAAGLVGDNTEFNIQFSYEDGGSIVTDTIVIQANGTPVNGPQDLPVGTVVTFSETGLPSIAGVDWGTPTFNPRVVTIGDGVNTRVTVTNSANSAAGGPGDPGDPGDLGDLGAGGSLAATGVDSTVAMMSAIALLVAGAGALILGQRRRLN